MPASALRELATLPQQVTGLYGTVWQGRATLRGSYALDWNVEGGGLILGRLRADVTVEGPDTRLQGQVSASPWAVTASEVTGRAGPGLLALAPGLGMRDCTSRAVVDIRTLSWSRTAAAAGGVVSVDAGTCADPLGRPTTVPQMTLDLSTQGQDARGVLSDRDSTLATVTLAGDRRLIVRVEPEGATMVPGLPTTGPIILEYPF